MEFSSLKYVDHQKEEGETYQQYFQRSFLRYKEMRQLLREIIDISNAKRQKKQYGFLRSFVDRELPAFDFIQDHFTFQLECLFKNLSD